MYKIYIMTDRYWRKIEDTENDIKNAMQISSILLKHQVYDKELSKIDTNEGNISSNLSKISDNENSISNNLSKIDNISKFLLKSDKDFEKIYNIEAQRFEFDKTNNYFTIHEKEIEHDFIKNSLLFIKNNMYYKYDDLEDDYHRCQHEYNIYGDNNLIHKYLFNKDTYYNENSNILNTNEEFCIFLKQDYNKIKIVLELHRHNRHGFGNIDLEIVDNNNYIKIEYIEQGFLDNSHLVNLNTGSISTNSGLINTNASSILTNSGLINTNTSSISDNKDLIDINTSSISTNLGKITTNTSDISDNLGLINTNTSSISTNSSKIRTNTFKISSNKGKIDTNISDISSNLSKIRTNTSSISSNLKKINDLQTSNIKAFYNLDQIFIYDIENGHQNVDKDNHFHIFKKEITYNFTKNSYLEIALKVLTEISNYVFIGFFQILCNFCDQNDNLFYTISLSTAAGSINKLSTIESVFIAPINENMSKIKIDFFIAPKESQQNRSAKFIIQDINSNKIYIKYFQKTNEMSIKDIQDSLNMVNSISNDLEKIENSIKLKNIKNILFYDERDQINFKGIFFDQTFELNIKKNDFIEIDLRMLLDYENINESHITITEFRLYDDDEQIYIATYNNGDSISYKNFVFINKYIFYNFQKDTKNLKIIIEFRMTRVEVVKIWYEPKNLDRFILKHYGN